MAVLMGRDARRDGDGVAEEVVRRWFERREAGVGLGGEKRDWRVDVEWDRRIVFGDSLEIVEKARL